MQPSKYKRMHKKKQNKLRRKNTEETQTVFVIEVPEFLFEKSRIALTYFGQPHEFVLRKLAIDDIEVSPKQQKLSLSLTSEFDKALIELSSEVTIDGGQQNLSGKLNIEQVDFSHYQHFCC